MVAHHPEGVSHQVSPYTLLIGVPGSPSPMASSATGSPHAPSHPQERTWASHMGPRNISLQAIKQ
ncbi:hypothetical protein EBZ35_03305 [bacterium]|nr:hypothetical protein [bacterium]